MGQPDYDALARSADTANWRAGIDGALRLTDQARREAALRTLRSVYEERLAPQFQAVPWGPTLIEHGQFRAAYESAKQLTGSFRNVGSDDLRAAMEQDPRTIAVFRLILGYTTFELAAALKLLEVTTSKAALDTIERGEGALTPQRKTVIAGIAEAVTGVIDRKLFALDEGLPVQDFRSRLDKIDTADGWTSVRRAAGGGVDYGDLLYERYLDGSWLAVRAAYSEKTGQLIEDAVADLLDENKIAYDRNPEELVRQGVFPSKPDFVLPDVRNPKVTIEAKGANDGGTARDKAARIANVAAAAEAAGLTPMAVIDGIGWIRRDALVQTLQATHGLTFSLSNLEMLSTIPEIVALFGTAD
jgi:hypothetical protein